jgi:hypothetical protein
LTLARGVLAAPRVDSPAPASESSREDRRGHADHVGVHLGGPHLALERGRVRRERERDSFARAMARAPDGA